MEDDTVFHIGNYFNLIVYFCQRKKINTFKIFFLKLDMKTKMIEAKCHEEKLKLQQKHDADVQKVGCVPCNLLLILTV